MNVYAGCCQRLARWPRAGLLAAVVAVLALLAAACGGSSTAANSFAPGATHAQSLAFAKCMRANGVPGFVAPSGPPPGSGGGSQG